MRLKTVLVLFVLLAADVDAQREEGRKRALLIGISDYSASRLARTSQTAPPPDRDWFNLQGAARDVGILREMLVLRYGFQERDVVTLTDQRATREAILGAIDKHLVSTAARDEVLLFYFAGHGSQVRNSLSDEPDRMDETLVPADSRAGARDIRDKELRSRFNAILDKGARLTVILDNCYSGSGARGVATGARPRGVSPDARDIADGTKFGPRPEDRGALVLSAAQDFGQAWETRDEQGTFHGAFTWALMHAMRDASALESASETFLRARARLRAGTPFQDPVMAGNAEACHAPFLGLPEKSPTTSPAVAAVEKVRKDGTTLLQGGWANGLAAGTELRVVNAAGTRLRVTTLIGAGRSEARIESGAHAVKPGALLAVAAWPAPGGRPLRIWMPRIDADASAIAALARRIATEAAKRGIREVDDPLEVTPVYLLRRGNREWELLDGRHVHRFADPIAALRTLPAGSSLFVQLPAPAAMIDASSFGARVERPEDADYILVGRCVRNRLEYALVRPAMMRSDRAKSSLPPRTEWIAVDRRGTLQNAALRLRRIHAWTSFDSPAARQSPYQLALRRARNGEIAKQVLVGKERYDVILRTATPARVRQRYVYVFVLDSFGRSILLFPRSGSVENRFPLALPSPPAIRLDCAFEVAPPYGVDTYFLLTTDEALPDPWALQWDGVRAGNVLSQATWSLEKAVYQSVPPRIK